jgi:hypothetical protein
MAVSEWHNRLMLSATGFAGFSAAHLIDEFIWGEPAVFHLSVPLTEILALAYMLALVGLIAAAGSRTAASYQGLSLAGGLIALADILKHMPEIAATGTWRFGPVSLLLFMGLTACALLTAFCGIMALRYQRGAPMTG